MTASWHARASPAQQSEDPKVRYVRIWHRGRAEQPSNGFYDILRSSLPKGSEFLGTFHAEEGGSLLELVVLLPRYYRLSALANLWPARLGAWKNAQPLSPHSRQHRHRDRLQAAVGAIVEHGVALGNAQRFQKACFQQRFCRRSQPVQRALRHKREQPELPQWARDADAVWQRLLDIPLDSVDWFAFFPDDAAEQSSVTASVEASCVGSDAADWNDPFWGLPEPDLGGFEPLPERECGSQETALFPASFWPVCAASLVAGG